MTNKAYPYPRKAKRARLMCFWAIYYGMDPEKAFRRMIVRGMSGYDNGQ